MRKFTMNSLFACAFAVALSVAVASPAVAQSGYPGQSGTSGSSADQGQNDQQKFVKKAALINMAEIQIAQLGVLRAQNPEVKQFAQTTVDEHTKALDELKQVASAANVELPTELDKKHQKALAKLSDAGVEEFDHEFMKTMVASHEQAEDLLEDRAAKAGDRAGAMSGSSSGSASGTSGSTGGVAIGTSGSGDISSRLDSWASTTLQSVRSHLQQAQELEDKVKRGGQ